MPTPLPQEEINAALEQLAGWKHEGDKLHKQFMFSNFREAIGFIVRMAFEAEQRDHHPELSNVYNRVEVALTTHDAGNRVTQKDLDLAKAIENL
jgi:4a-hydroxytetrahydrobiopterin dehydratase